MEQQNGFPNTHWSLVRRAGQSDEQSRHEALQALLRRYEPALMNHLCVAKRVSAENAEDVLQSFIADKMLQQEFIGKADRSRGRFRSLLISSLNNYLVSWYRKGQIRQTQKLPTIEEESHNALRPDQAMEVLWARELVRSVLADMRFYCERRNRQDIWYVFEARVVGQVTKTNEPPSYEALAQSLKLNSPTQAANLLVSGKRLFERLLRERIGEYELDAEAIDAEIQELRAILARGMVLDNDD